MSLRTKVIGLILFIFSVYGALDYGVQRMFILPSFYALEQEESLKNMDRAVAAIQREIQHLGLSATDWSVWDDTYRYVQDRNEAYREANLNKQAINSLKMNFLYLFDADQQLVWGMAYDLDRQQEIEIPELVEKLGGIHLTDPQTTVEGILVTANGPALISAKPILTSDNKGPVKGYLVLGRFLNTASIAEQIRIGLHTTILGAETMNLETDAILAQLHGYDDTIVRNDGADNQVYKVMPDVDGKPALLLRVDVPKLISSKGEKDVRFALLSLLGAGLVIVVVLIIGLQQIVLNPLRRLTDHTVTMGQSNDLSVHLALNRKDEIGTLSQEFDRMVERLAMTRQSLMEQSYQSGMAEVAIGVLHNVGNVLNSVNVSCAMLMTQLRESNVGDVAKVADLMTEPEGGLCHFLTEDSRGQMIPTYLASLATALEEERQVMLKETESLHDRIEHIKEIVVMQQGYGRISTLHETIVPEQFMEDALKFSADALTLNEVTVQREYQAVPPISVDKHKVLQILVNLINNAQNACTDDGGNKEKIITLRIFSPNSNGVNIQVADNGIGIARENLTRIFQYGFTTRKSGHGFGLHSSALTARELGGSLTVHSDGLGCGAIFTLELPCQAGNNT